MTVAISWANKMQLAKCDIMVGFPISSHIYVATWNFAGLAIDICFAKFAKVFPHQNLH